MLPVKVETWRMDVEASEPEFVLDHELTEYYDLPDLSPASIDALSKRFATDSELSLKYQQTKGQHGLWMPTTCDESCMVDVSCQTSHSVWWDIAACEGKDPKNLRHETTDTLWEMTMDPWYSHHVIPKKTDLLQ